MRSALAFSAAALAAQAAVAQLPFSQARLQDDCLQRLKPIIPREVKTTSVGFGALGNYGTYYVVSYAFDADLENGQRKATCTYRRDGGWVRDDAQVHKLTRELASDRRRPESGR